MELEEIKQKIEEAEALWLKEDELKLDLDYNLLRGVLQGIYEGCRNWWDLKKSVSWLINTGVVGFRTLYVKNGSVQTERFANRSTKDLFLILRFYRPELKLIDLIRVLVELVDSEEIKTLWCHNIKRVTWFAKINERDYGNQTRGTNEANRDGESELGLIHYYKLTELIKEKENAKSADITKKEGIPAYDTVSSQYSWDITPPVRENAVSLSDSIGIYYRTGRHPF